MKSYTEFLNEAFSAKMKDVFTSSQLAKIGSYLHDNAQIDIQNSTFKYYDNKTFKIKDAVENSYAVCKLVDGSYIIILALSQRNYSVVLSEDKGRFFKNGKDALNQATDIFIFEDLKTARDVRFVRNSLSKVTDPLQIKQNKLDKQKKYTNEYSKKIMDLAKEAGLKPAPLYLINYGDGTQELSFVTQHFNVTFDFGIETRGGALKAKFIRSASDNVSATNVTSATIDNAIKQLKALKLYYDAISLIDYKKLPVVDM